MSLQDKKQEIESGKEKIPSQEQPARFEREKNPERKEISQDEKNISDKLKREIELMDADDSLKKQAEQKANKISFLADDDKLKNLLKIAREKGVVFATQVARKMNDPFILDTLHDALAQEGFYKDFTK